MKTKNKTRTHELCRVVSKPWAYASCWMTFVRLGRRNKSWRRIRKKRKERKGEHEERYMDKKW